MTTPSIHIPVMRDEVIRYLRGAEGGSFLDCTLGGAGHTKALLDANPKNEVVAIDRDSRAVERGRETLRDLSSRCSVMHLPFSGLADALEGRRFSGMLADLGVSTDQLKEQRGFSFADSTPLDMRMDEHQGMTAHHLINEVAERDLYIALREGGVGPEAKAVARAIVSSRPIARTDELAAIVQRALHGHYRQKAGNPATVVFQAIRMAVNRELQELDALLEAAPHLVAANGRLAIITFHSLEDKVVTHQMRRWASGDPVSALSRNTPRQRSLGRMVEKKAVEPSAEECQRNPSSRSARLRVFEFN